MTEINMHTVVNQSPGHVAILRSSLVQICDGNHCAAMLLDHFYEETLFHGKFVETTTNNLVRFLCGLFSECDIDYALDLLASKHYVIVIKKMRDLQTSPDDFYKGYISYNTSHHTVDKALTILRGKTPEPIIERVAQQSNQQEQLDVRPIQTIHPNRKEAKRVAYHLARASKLALPALLTLDQWMATLEYFGWKCAYCGQGEYEVFEHFIPLFHGGGTTYNNCVPACMRCNARKNDLHPSVFQEKMGDAIQHIQNYLKSLSGRAEA